MSTSPEKVEVRMPEPALEEIRERARAVREEHPELCEKLNEELHRHRQRKILGLSEGPGEAEKDGESEPKELGEAPPPNILELAGGTQFLSSLLDR